MAMIGIYNLRLICDNAQCMNARSQGEDAGVAEYEGYDRASALKEARKDGWLINTRTTNAFRDYGRALCPDHSGKKDKTT